MLENDYSICSHCLTDAERTCHLDCTAYERYKAARHTLAEVFQVLDGLQQQAAAIGPHLATSPGAKLFYNGKDSAIEQIKRGLRQRFNLPDDFPACKTL